MTKEEARREMDLITHHNGDLRSTFTNSERRRLDELRAIAFADPVTPVRGVRIGGKDFVPTASSSKHDFFPPEVVAVIMEKSPELRKSAARSLHARIARSADAYKNRHPFHDQNAGDHEAWQIAMEEIVHIAAFDEDE